MSVKSISFPSPTELEDIENLEDDNIDVFVELEDGCTYVVIVATCQNLVSLMDKEKSDFLKAGHPFIIVRKLTKAIIEQAIETYTDNDAYWLKLHHFSADFDISTLNKLRDEQIQEVKAFDELDNS